MGLPALQMQKKQLVEELRTVANTGTSSLSDGERAKVDELTSKIEATDADIQRMQKADAMLAAQQPETPSCQGQASEWGDTLKRFSLRKAITNRLARLEGRQVESTLEDEVGQEVERRSGRKFEGVPVPLEVFETRDLTTATTSNGGGNVIGDDWRPDQFIPFLYDQSVSAALGVQMLRGLSSGTLKIPKGKASINGGWASETGALSESDPTFEQISLSPKKAGVISEFTKQLMLQSSPQIENIIRQDMAMKLALLVDSAMIGGLAADANRPTGILGSYNSSTKAFASPAVAATAQSGTTTNGKKPALVDWYALAEKVESANIRGNISWLINPKTKYSLMQQVKFASTDSVTLFNNGMLLGMPAVVSNIMPSNFGKGSVSNLSAAIVGRFSEIIAAYWQDLELLVNPFSDAAYKAGNIQVRAMLHMDIAYRRPEALAYYNDIVTA